MRMKNKETKRLEAEQRNEEHRSLSTREKLAKATSRPGGSKREVARLTRQLSKEG
jgi:hypothetical protein